MILDNVALVAADTTRSRAYLQSLIRHKLLPNFVLLLEHQNSVKLPGQLAGDKSNSRANTMQMEGDWSEADFDAELSLRQLLSQHEIPFQVTLNADINHSSIISILSARNEEVFIYSGYGGILLGRELLSCGKRFLHVHGGYLPEYKGSTTNYYSILVENKMGASSMFLSEEIDSGPVLVRREFPMPPNTLEIDHCYDSAARAKVLIETLKRHVESGKWEFELSNNLGGETYYVIHPVLKHIAILAKTD